MRSLYALFLPGFPFVQDQSPNKSLVKDGFYRQRSIQRLHNITLSGQRDRCISGKTIPTIRLLHFTRTIFPSEHLGLTVSRGRRHKVPR